MSASEDTELAKALAVEAEAQAWGDAARRVIALEEELYALGWVVVITWARSERRITMHVSPA